MVAWLSVPITVYERNIAQRDVSRCMAREIPTISPL